MKKLAPLLLCLFLFSQHIYAQTGYWAELGGVSPVLDTTDGIYCMHYDINSGALYAPFFEHATGKLVIAKYSGGSWQKFSSPDTFGSNTLNAGEVYAVAEDASGNFYMAGTFNAGYYDYVVKWDGTNWTMLGGDSSTLFPNDQVNALACDNNGNVYAGGDFEDNTGYGYVAEWNGTTWNELGPPQGLYANGGSNTNIWSIVVDAGNYVYANGTYWYQGEPDNHVFEWVGSNWYPLDSDGAQTLSGLNGDIFCLGYDGNLYGFGQNHGNGTNQFCISTWNAAGRYWPLLGNYVPANTGYQALCADGYGHVYVSSNDIDVTGNPYINGWNGTSWAPLGSNSTALHPNGNVRSVACNYYGSQVYASGNFKDPHRLAYVAVYSILNQGNMSVFINPNPADCQHPGSITTTVNNGTPPYTYIWSNGDTTANPDSLAAGYYYLTVQDAAGLAALGYTQVYNNCVYFINGTAYQNAALNCNYDSTSVPMAGITIDLVSASTGISYNGFTDSLGRFSIRIPAAGTYIFNTDVNYYGKCSLLKVCSGAGDTIILSGPTGDSINNIIIGVSNATFDFTMHMSWSPANPGFQKKYWIYPINLSGVPYTGLVTVVFTYDSNLIYQYTQAPYPVVDTINHTVTWTLNGSSIPAPGWGPYLGVTFLVPATLSLNYQMQAGFVIYPVTGDCDTSNNRYNFSQPVTGSHDPNSKEVSPSGTVYRNDSVFTYTIHYQNTGTDSTYFIVVKDTLSPYLDPASVQNIASSSDYSAFNVSGSGVLTWTFNPLRLPYKSIDSTGSQGFITFRAKIKGNTPPSVDIANSASIYFDYNNPIKTNTVVDSVVPAITYINQSAAICSGDSFVVGIHHYLQSGNYTDTLFTRAMLDSVIINTSLTVAPALSSSFTRLICSTDSVQLGNIWYRATGSYNYTFTATGGCDSIVTLNLTVNPAYYDTTTQTICQGQSYEGHSATGTFTDTLQAVNSCDSILILQLTVLNNDTSTIYQTICQGQSYGGHTTSGTFIDTLQAANSCDSIRTLHLTVLPVIHTTVTDSICAGHSYAGYSSTGTYVDTYQSWQGCDSIRILILTILPVAATTVTQSICPGQNYYGYYVSGTYVDTFSAVNTCDSIRTLNLTVSPAIATNITQNICPGQFYYGHDTTGTYVDSFTATGGCDSVRTLHLVVNRVYNDTISNTICQGDTFNGHDTTGYYTDTLQTINGCDSIVTLNLTVTPSPTATISATQQLCSSQNCEVRFIGSAPPAAYYNWNFDGASIVSGSGWGPYAVKWGSAGTPVVSLAVSVGNCAVVTDSVPVTVNQAPVVTLSWDSMIMREDFFAVDGDTVYCHELNNVVPLSGGRPGGGTYTGPCIINNLFYADSALSYLHIYADTIYYTYTDSNGCTGTASNMVYLFNCLGIPRITSDNSITLYPNPATDQLFIKTENIQPQTITVYDVDGRQIFTQPFTPEIDINRLSSGVYFVEVTGNAGVVRKRFVKM